VAVDGIREPWACYDLSKRDCKASLGCEWTYKGAGRCRPKFALKPLRTREAAKEAVDRVVATIRHVPEENLTRAFREGFYLTNTLPHSPSWRDVPWEVKQYLMWEGKERVLDAYLERARKAGRRTRIRVMVPAR